MAFRFRKTFSIAPGIRLNIGKKGASVRLGPKGLGYTFGSSGQHLTAGIPGTGLSMTTKLDASGRHREEVFDMPGGNARLIVVTLLFGLSFGLLIGCLL